MENNNNLLSLRNEKKASPSVNGVKIAVIAVFDKSIAIWNCMRQHINLMEAGGASVLIYVKNTEAIEFIQEEYRARLVVFESKRDLKVKLKANATEVIWYPTNISMKKYGRPSNNCRILLWIQGSDADESWMRNHSRLRILALNYLERRVFHKADGLIYVSDSMRTFYEEKYKHSFKNYAVVPCVSDFHDFRPCAERKPESYVYIGGLSVWQCFDEIVDIYGKVRTANSVFHVITMDTENALKVVKSKLGEAKDVSIYSITDRSRIPEILSTFQYGFLIRKDSPVNFVSSPIKFLEYLSCGVNVIMTDAVPSYARLIRENNVGTIVDVDNLDRVEINAFSPNAREVYEKCFNREQFVEQYRELISNSIKC